MHVIQDTIQRKNFTASTKPMKRWCVLRSLLLITVGVFLSVIGIFTFDVFCNELISNFGDVVIVNPDGVQHPAPLVSAGQRHDDTEEWSSGRLFSNDRPLTLLSIDYHASPINDVKHLLQPLGVRFIQKDVMSYSCRYFNDCRTTGHPVKDYMVSNSFHWVMSYKWAERFYSKYRDNADWRSADAFICFHPSATCELFVPFDKPIIVLSTIRIDNGRMLPGQRRAWLNTLATRIARDRRNVVAANNLYDAAYTRFFTGIQPLLLTSYCGYTGRTYTQSRPGFLVGPRPRSPSFTRYFLRRWTEAVKALNVTDVQLTSIDELYPESYSWGDMAAHQGVVNLPIQPSMMSIFEQYRMNIPLFFPSHRLLVEWQLERNVLDEINLYGVLGATFQPHTTQTDIPHPNLRTRDSVEYWLRLCDWYQQLPHVVLYDSFEDLARTLHRLTGDQLWTISKAMKDYNRQFEAQLLRQWREVLFRVAGNISNNLVP